MKRFFVALIGGTVVLIGIVMIVLPGPAVVVIPAGLAILATEFAWARRALRRAKGAAAKVRRKSGLGAWLRRRSAARRQAVIDSAGLPLSPRQSPAETGPPACPQ